MRRSVMLLVAVMAVTGCTSWHYDKPGVTSAQVRDDLTDCRRSSLVASGVSLPNVSADQEVTVPETKVDRAAFNSCMSQRGYSVWWD
jgi:hypothetical protein